MPSTTFPIWLQPAEDHTAILHLYIQPGGRQSTCLGIHDQRLKIRIAAPPVDGAANKLLLTYLAKLLRIRRAQIALIRGETSRRKDIRLTQVCLEEITAALVAASIRSPS